MNAENLHTTTLFTSPFSLLSYKWAESGQLSNSATPKAVRQSGSQAVRQSGSQLYTTLHKLCQLTDSIIIIQLIYFSSFLVKQSFGVYIQQFLEGISL